MSLLLNLLKNTERGDNVKNGLGKGLNSLIKESIKKDEKTIIEMQIDKIMVDKNQPRKYFEDESINELATSIKNVGVLSPILIKQIGEFYQIISGERRFRASRIAGLRSIPVIIKNYDKLETIQVALIENIQREDLNIIEEANIYNTFVNEFNLTQEQVAQKVGKNRTTITNAIRLLKLDERIQNFVIQKSISMGHAKILLSVQDENLKFELAEKIIEEELSVRQLENIIKKIDDIEISKNIKQKNKNENLLKIQLYTEISNELKQILGTKVNIKERNNKGKIEIEYYNEKDLDRIICMLKDIE